MGSAYIEVSKKDELLVRLSNIRDFVYDTLDTSQRSKGGLEAGSEILLSYIDDTIEAVND